MSTQRAATSSFAHFFDVREVLNFVIILFQAAVKHEPQGPVKSITLRPIDDTEFPLLKNLPVYDIQYFRALALPGDFKASGATELRGAVTSWNNCDHFCGFAYAVLPNYLKPYQATVKWICIRPRPKLWLTRADGSTKSVEKDVRFPKHSILAVELQDRDRLVVDGSGEQYGWEPQTSIMNWGEFWEKHGHWVNDEKIREEHGYGDVSGDLKEFLEDRSLYWDAVMESLWDLFGQCLDSGELKALSRDAREQQVRKWAEESASQARG
ncbi:hypothetical protein T440DRAFT_555125 [Plenodomus tracheiphilus IPT5]|uniref:Uncharacterized protein n=1 Tax=Plenodomus tracheiphilus IPT5 TaxID=1408161 RepID=A0A6A7B4X6_9PLEO|nr:hypothetical protein T440DRAFT_555125 [Plenodomus tracheiphilus IPT5]